MEIKDLLRQLYGKWWLFVIFPTMLAGLVYYLTGKTPKVYESSAVVYTGVASGKSFDIGGGGVRYDFNKSNNAFDNLILTVRSRQTLEIVGLKLLAQHLSLEEENGLIIAQGNKLEVVEQFDPETFKELVVRGDEKKTYELLTAYYNSRPSSVVHYLLAEHPFYAPMKISGKLKASRKFTSDMLELVYESTDPGVCKNTLSLLVETFMERHQKMRGRENESAVRYFQEQLEKAYQKLQESEARLKTFISQNGILNFYEQGKNLDNYRNDVEKDEQQTRMTIAGAESTLKKLEEEIAKATARSEIVDSLYQLRQESVKIRGQIMAGNLYGVADQEREERLRLKLESNNEKIKQFVSGLYRNDFSIEGIPLSEILQEWLHVFLERERQLSTLTVARETREFIERRVDYFAPLGAELKKLEREVTVHENQYLSILHGLNQANLQKQSSEMAENMEVVDDPYFPRNPQGSKRLILVAGSFFAGVMLILALIVLKLLLDNTVRTVDRAEKYSGLKCIGYYGEQEQIQQKKLEIPAVNLMCTRQLVSQLKVLSDVNKPYSDSNIITICSSKENEGKTHIARQIAEYMQELYGDVLLVSHKDSEEAASLEYLCQHYEIKHDFLELEDISALTHGDKPANAFSYIILVLPPYELASLPFKLMQRAAELVYVIDSTRIWTKSDSKLMDLLLNMKSVNTWVVLNKMHSIDLEDVMGDIGKREGKVKKWLKKMLSKLL
ncbi:MAG: hypothetical protein LAT76_02330 [Schleiferiaceae bacterium]|nr:hypothetical protein [Schleiferiaceae bacterium]